MSALALGAACVIVALAYFVRGVSGFGSATIAIPLLVHFVSLKMAVPLLLVLDLVSTAATVTIDRSAVDRSEVRALVPAAIVGVISGVTLLVSAPAEPLLAALGVLVVVFGFNALRTHEAIPQPVSRWWALPAGVAGGALGGAFGSGGATPCMIYLTRRIDDRHRLRGTFSAYAILDYSFRFVVFAAAGLLLEHDFLVLLAATVPGMIVGFFLGNRLHRRLSNERVGRVIGVLLVASGVSLLAKAAF